MILISSGFLINTTVISVIIVSIIGMVTVENSCQSVRSSSVKTSHHKLYVFQPDI